MIKDVWEFYSAEKDAMVKLPVSIMTQDEFFQYCDTIKRVLFTDSGPRSHSSQELRINSAFRQSVDRWLESCDGDILLYAICDDSEYDYWFAIGTGKYDSEGKLQYCFD